MTSITETDSETDIYKPCTKLFNFSKAPLEWKAMAADCPPGKELPPEYLLDRKRLDDPSYERPTHFFYGFGLNIGHVIEYHRARRLSLPPPQILGDRVSIWRFLIDSVVNHLRDVCEYDGLRVVYARSLEYDLVLAMYNSYKFRYEELTDEEEVDVIRLLREEMPGVFGN
ncbi:hypothetical protein GYMLUDRAFT_98624 [Collybiopsis luxurians FD-317 M1]|uniref:Unplaced genomic scaffold GYMLUscaffold_42, whole genome shotgun sequence n=1 Tax=Collybiopsis luxurians FD-317 M1 TaxID=944289 RepID=A0A0D0CH61_9AGAR|nr:hypothetical protein GYMLUDRAFT_98624 [Collybiopsis luxurians FD-317 M1]